MVRKLLAVLLILTVGIGIAPSGRSLAGSPSFTYSSSATDLDAEEGACHEWPELPGKCMPIKHPEPPCIVYTQTAPTLDENGVVVPGSPPITSYDVVCPSTDSRGIPSKSSQPDAQEAYQEVPLGCNWGQQPWTNGQMAQGTAQRWFFYDWYDENGRQGHSAHTGYVPCGYAQCTWSSSVAGSPYKKFTHFGWNHPVWMTVLNKSCL